VASAHTAHEPGQTVRSLSLADLQRIAAERDGQRLGPGGADRQVAQQVTDAVRGVVFAGALVSLLALAATLAVPELPLKSAPRAEERDEARAEPAVASG